MAPGVRPAPALALVALVLASAPLPLFADALCAPPGTDGAFVARGAALSAWPGGQLLWTAPADAGTVFSLACDGTRVAAGLAREDGRGRIVVLERGSSGWTSGAEIALRGVPAALALSGERIAVVVRERRRTVLGFAGTAGGRLEERDLHGVPKALAASPDGEAFLVALDDGLRTFRAADGGTWLVYDLPGAATALAARQGVPRVLVARVGALDALDLRDTPVRGVLPVRATAELDSVALWLAWADDAGRVAAALLAQGPALVFYAGQDLRELERVGLPEMPTALAGLDGGRVLWLDTRGEAHVAEPGAGALATARAPRFEPLPVVKDEEPQAPPAAARAEPVPASPPVAKAEPPPPPPPAAKAEPPRAANAEPPPPPPLPPPVEKVEPPPVVVEDAPAAGTIAGVLRGQAALVAELVIAGPDNITRIAARVTPDRGTFRATGLAPGTYRVTPMGAKGATLRTAPGFATVKLAAGNGARVDFQVVGAW